MKLEIECFSTGAYWAIGKIRSGDFWTDEGVREQEPGLLADPLWLTLFFGWDGQSWSPPTVRSLQYMVDNLPPNANWSMSCMEPPVYWSMVAHTIAVGGHVRIGMEDCPYLQDGAYAKTNAELVEKAVRIAREIGRGHRLAGGSPADRGPVSAPAAALRSENRPPGGEPAAYEGNQLQLQPAE